MRLHSHKTTLYSFPTAKNAKTSFSALLPLTIISIGTQPMHPAIETNFSILSNLENVCEFTKLTRLIASHNKLEATAFDGLPIFPKLHTLALNHNNVRFASDTYPVRPSVHPLAYCSPVTYTDTLICYFPPLSMWRYATNGLIRVVRSRRLVIWLVNWRKYAPNS